jgi:hypothetical protein
MWSSIGEGNVYVFVTSYVRMHRINVVVDRREVNVYVFVASYVRMHRINVAVDGRSKCSRICYITCLHAKNKCGHR